MLCEERRYVNQRLRRRALQPRHPDLLRNLRDAPASWWVVVAVEATRMRGIHQVDRRLIVWQEPRQR